MLESPVDSTAGGFRHLRSRVVLDGSALFRSRPATPGLPHTGDSIPQLSHLYPFSVRRSALYSSLPLVHIGGAKAPAFGPINHGILDVALVVGVQRYNPSTPALASVGEGYECKPSGGLSGVYRCHPVLAAFLFLQHSCLNFNSKKLR